MMSLWDDYKTEYLLARDYPHGVPCNTWVSKNGPIAVKDMSDSHIQNCMRLVGEDDPWYGRFAKELDRRRNG